MGDQQEIRYDRYVVRRQGDVLSIASAHFDPILVITLTPSGGIEINREWLEGIQAEEERRARWFSLLDSLGVRELRPLCRARPPAFVPEDKMLDYLQAIANGEIAINCFGEKSRGILTQALLARKKAVGGTGKA
jgi:hypothetical protein